MTTDDITTLDFTRPCPVCDHHMDLSTIETVPWATRTAGERVVFRCEKCGVTQAEWNTISLPSPDIAPT
jgi:C4-type Zn-finger protein